MMGIKKMQERKRAENGRLRGSPPAPLIGYMRVSKADGSQVLDLQRDALLAAGVRERHLYSDAASGKKDDRPAFLHASKPFEGDTLVVELDRLGRNFGIL
jgi:DNA invertase Pin-like site-specific DNA recombinase